MSFSIICIIALVAITPVLENLRYISCSIFPWHLAQAPILKYLPNILAYNDKGKLNIKRLSLFESSIADDTFAWSKYKFILLNYDECFC